MQSAKAYNTIEIVHEIDSLLKSNTFIVYDLVAKYKITKVIEFRMSCVRVQ